MNGRENHPDHCTEVLEAPAPDARLTERQARDLIALPKPSCLPEGSLANVLIGRKTCRTFTDEAVSLEDVGTLLYLSLGYLHERENDVDETIVEGLGARTQQPVRRRAECLRRLSFMYKTSAD